MFIKVCRIGSDPDLRYTPNNEPVVNLDLAYNIGYGEKAKTQWIRAAFFGSRAEKVHPYLKKGGQVLLTGDDVCVEEWASNGKSGATLKCRVVNLELLGSKNENQQGQQQQQSQASEPSAPPARKPAPAPSSFDNFDDDKIPF